MPEATFSSLHSLSSLHPVHDDYSELVDAGYLSGSESSSDETSLGDIDMVEQSEEKLAPPAQKHSKAAEARPAVTTVQPLASADRKSPKTRGAWLEWVPVFGVFLLNVMQ